MKEQWKIYKRELNEAWESLRTKGKRKTQIPNILTSLRLFAPVFILPASFFEDIPLVLFFVGIFSITDMLDGFIARTFHFTSELGKDLDAFCDKVFAGTLLLAASFLNPIMVMSLFLEIVIASINVYAQIKGRNPKSLSIGKVKTFFLFPLLGLSLVNGSKILEKFFKILFGITIILQLWTVCAYRKKYQVVGRSCEESNVLLEES